MSDQTKDPQDRENAPEGSGLDTGTKNEDLHGQAEEVAESANEPGAAETPAG